MCNGGNGLWNRQLLARLPGAAPPDLSVLSHLVTFPLIIRNVLDAVNNGRGIVSAACESGTAQAPFGVGTGLGAAGAVSSLPAVVASAPATGTCPIFCFQGTFFGLLGGHCVKARDGVWGVQSSHSAPAPPSLSQSSPKQNWGLKKRKEGVGPHPNPKLCFGHTSSHLSLCPRQSLTLLLPGDTSEVEQQQISGEQRLRLAAGWDPWAGRATARGGPRWLHETYLAR